MLFIHQALISTISSARQSLHTVKLASVTIGKQLDNNLKYKMIYMKENLYKKQNNTVLRPQLHVQE